MVDAATLAAVNEAVLKIQKSARRTVPMFFIGIIATIVAAVIGVYYIVTLSADLREARRALGQSQAALSQARADLATINEILRHTQGTASSPARAEAIAGVISDVARSENSIAAASSSIEAATVKISQRAGGGEDSSQPGKIGSCRLVINGVTQLAGRCRIELASGGSFRINSVDGTGPSAYLKVDGPLGTATWQQASDQPAVELGALQRQGACWSNQSVTVCAWK
jgi:type II secretory pathway pseudopilin PulG